VQERLSPGPLRHRDDPCLPNNSYTVAGRVLAQTIIYITLASAGVVQYRRIRAAAAMAGRGTALAAGTVRAAARLLVELGRAAGDQFVALGFITRRIRGVACVETTDEVMRAVGRATRDGDGDCLDPEITEEEEDGGLAETDEQRPPAEGGLEKKKNEEKEEEKEKDGEEKKEEDGEEEEEDGEEKKRSKTHRMLFEIGQVFA